MEQIPSKLPKKESSQKPHGRSSDHYKLVVRIAQEMDMPVNDVQKIIRRFFRHIRVLVKNKIPVRIKYFGSFYFHKNMLDAKERRDDKEKEKVKEYNARTKQKLYNRRRRARQKLLGLPRT